MTEAKYSAAAVVALAIISSVLVGCSDTKCEEGCQKDLRRKITGIESDVEGSCNLKHIRETYSKLIASEFEKLKKLYDGRKRHEASSPAKHHSGVKKNEACDKDLIDTTEVFYSGVWKDQLNTTNTQFRSCCNYLSKCVIDVQSYSSKNVAGERFGYVKVNGEVVLNGSSDGKQGPNRPGIHTLILHPLTCSVGRWRWFNTHNSSTEAENFVNYLFGHGEHSLRTGLVVIVVSFDDGFENLTDNVFDALKISGVDIRDVKCYGQFAFITQVGYSGYPGKLKFSKDPAHDDCKALKLSAQIQGATEELLTFVSS